jgi:hypothetical protein
MLQPSAVKSAFERSRSATGEVAKKLKAGYVQKQVQGQAPMQGQPPSTAGGSVYRDRKRSAVSRSPVTSRSPEAIASANGRPP